MVLVSQFFGWNRHRDGAFNHVFWNDRVRDPAGLCEVLLYLKNVQPVINGRRQTVANVANGLPNTSRARWKDLGIDVIYKSSNTVEGLLIGKPHIQDIGDRAMNQGIQDGHARVGVGQLLTFHTANFISPL